MDGLDEIRYIGPGRLIKQGHLSVMVSTTLKLMREVSGCVDTNLSIRVEARDPKLIAKALVADSRCSSAFGFYFHDEASVSVVVDEGMMALVGQPFNRSQTYFVDGEVITPNDARYRLGLDKDKARLVETFGGKAILDRLGKIRRYIDLSEVISSS